MHRGHRLIGKLLCIDRREASSLRFGVTASKRYGNAPERNRFKRLVREAFRTSRTLLPQDVELNILPRHQAKGAMMGEIQKELLRLVGLPPHVVKSNTNPEPAPVTHFGKPLFPDVKLC